MDESQREIWTQEDTNDRVKEKVTHMGYAGSGVS